MVLFGGGGRLLSFGEGGGEGTTLAWYLMLQALDARGVCVKSALMRRDAIDESVKSALRVCLDSDGGKKSAVGGLS